jgi:hypothetical protein
MIGRKVKVLLLVYPLLAIGCALFDETSPKKPATTGLIATPPIYYSTARARYLGNKYKENLDRLIERIVRNPKTSTLQFANNISSVGGIGFFTHSAAKTADERYLEVVLAAPETFETKGELSDKVHQLFSRYGMEILGILSGDSDIYQDKELSGYGLNLAWRNILAEPTGNRVTLARAIIYFPKERVRNFLRHELNQNDLLGNAVIFSVEEEGPLTLVSYQPQEARPDVRPAIREDNLASVPAAPRPAPSQLPPAPAKEFSQKVEPGLEVAKKDTPPAKDMANSTVAKPSPTEAKVDSKQEIPVVQKNSAVDAKPNIKASDAPKKAKPVAEAEHVAATKGTEVIIPRAPVDESKDKSSVVAAKTTSQPMQEVTVPSAVEPPVEKKVSPAPTARADKDVSVEKIEQPRKDISAPPVPKPVAETKKNEPVVKPVPDGPKPAPAVATPKTVIEAKKPETISNEKPAAAVVTKLPVDKPSVAQEAAKGKESPTVVAKAQSAAPVAVPARELAPPKSAEKVPEAKTREPGKTEQAVVKASEQPLPPAAEAKPPIGLPSVAKMEAQAQPPKAPAPAGKATIEEKVENVKSRETVPVQTAKSVIEDKNPAAKTPDKVTAPASTAKPSVQSSVAEKIKPAPATEEAKGEMPRPAARLESLAAPVKLPAANASAPDTPAPPAVKPTPPPARPREAAKPSPGAGAEKAEPPLREAKPSTSTAAAAPQRETAAEKPAGEQLALLRKPADVTAEKKPPVRPAPKALEGFIIQLGFNDKEKAQRWAETMERRGYAVSVTEAGAEGVLRVRLGNFSIRDEAERQLRTFKQEGLNGIIINLPQGFRPEARSSIP